MARLRTPALRKFAGHIEHLEDRCVMSVDPLVDLVAPVGSSANEPPAVEQSVLAEPDFWIDPAAPTDLDDYFGQVSQMLSSAHALTGWNSVQQNYGFTGRGQTVAVIDSGIAWDHFALGGGLGAGYRVVGGWDFSDENDSNPYDDGPSGSHGTHVSGIIGGNSSTNSGVAPGVDFVGLRVFNDQGQGFFMWIENALRWIHNNRNSFANPITTVNLSLGVSSWNADTVPEWAELEDEFAQLEADGIFIAVSAGNAFNTYKTPGLSYPAASQYVVPVMSVTDAGTLSTFSQRLGRAIAAPGQSITSTVPDYSGNGNGTADDFGTKSGTSMAAPYVAGASVLIRQAMQFVGRTGITQDTIYDHMLATADTFFDSVTNQSYKRLNLGRAIDALMPTDDYGSTADTAHNLGALSGEITINGKLSRLTDVDCFRFTATASGTVTFRADADAGMTPTWQVWGATRLPSEAGTIKFQVVAGQSYTVGLSSPGTTGNYTITTGLDAAGPAFTFTDWGAVGFNTQDNVSVAGERWYRIQASRAGVLTVQAAFDVAGGSVNVALYNSSRQLVANGGNYGSVSRVDTWAAAGGEFYLKVTGANADVDFKLANLLSQSGGAYTVVGTSGADAVTLTAGATHQLSINGLRYSLPAADASGFTIDGLGGADTLTVTGTTGNESATLRVGSAAITGSGWIVTATNFESQSFAGGGGTDEATLYDSAGDDVFTATPTYATLTGAGFAMRVDGVDAVTARSNSAGSQRDVANLYGSDGDDRYLGRATSSTLDGAGYRITAAGFDRVDVFAGAGAGDQAYLYDTAGNDVFAAKPEYSVLSGDGYFNVARGFDRVEAVASAGGWDRAYLNDSAGDDMFVARPDYVHLSGAGFYNFASGFDQIDAYAFAGGADRAYLYDSAGDDVFTGRPEYSLLAGNGFYNLAWAFESVWSYATAGGRDTAYLHDSEGDDRYEAAADYATLAGAGFSYQAQQFEEVYAYAFAGGTDRATFRDSAGDDIYSSSPSGVTARSGGRVNAAYAFDDYAVEATAGGQDVLDLRGLAGLDSFYGRASSGTLTRAGSRLATTGLDDISLWTEDGARPTVDVDAVDYVFRESGA
jgi:hypothetical protein